MRNADTRKNAQDRLRCDNGIAPVNPLAKTGFAIAEDMTGCEWASLVGYIDHLRMSHAQSNYSHELHITATDCLGLTEMGKN